MTTRRCDVDLVDVGQNEARAAQLRADRRHDVTHFELARRHLGQHRRKERVVVAAKQDDLRFAGAQALLEPPGDRDSRKTSADDHDDRHAIAVEEGCVQYLPPVVRSASPSRRNRRSGAVAASAPSLAAVVAFFAQVQVSACSSAPSYSRSAGRFLLSLWIYVVIFGWKLAVVVMLLLLAHELGHYFAFRAYGLPVRLPAFVPLLGAFTAGAPPEDLEHDAYIALAGPLIGLGLAAVCYAIGDATHDRFWYACADLSAFLNLFNMIPMPPFDGGRIIGALWPPLWIVGFVALRRLRRLLAHPDPVRRDHRRARTAGDARGVARPRRSARAAHDVRARACASASGISRRCWDSSSSWRNRT